MAERIAKRVLLIGWDAADWQMIRPLMDAGHMPALQGLMQRGVWGNLATLQPVLSPMLWTSIATGKTADKHGIHGFTEPLPDHSGIRPVSSVSRTCKALWNILSQNDLRSNVVGWYASHPAEPIKGTMVSNQFEHPVGPPDQPWPVPDGAVHPAERADELAELRVHPTEIDATAVLPFLPDAKRLMEKNDERLRKFRQLMAQTASIHAVATQLVAQDDWDLTAVYYEGIDRFGHEFMEFHPPKMEQVSQEDFDAYRHAMEGIYRFHDMMLQTLLKLAGDDTAVILLSDHGYYNDHQRPDPREGKAGPTDWHRPFGMVCMAGPGVKPNDQLFGASLLDVTPTVLRLLGLPVGMDMSGRAWVEAFDPPLTADRIVSWEAVEGDAGQHPADAAGDPEAQKAALQQLIDLGYVEAPGEDVQQSVDDTVAHNALNLSTALMSINRHADALELLDGLPEKWQTQDALKLKVALCCLAAGDTPRAERIAAELADKDDGPLRARMLLGAIAMSRRDFGAALEHFTAVESAAPETPGLCTRLGGVYLQTRQPEKAERAFEKALRLDDDSAVALDGLAQACLALNRPDDALDHALSAVGLVHHFPRGHLHVGQALAALKDYEHAAEALELCLRQASQFVEAHRALAEVYRQLGRGDDAARQDFLAAEAQTLRRQKAAPTAAAPAPDSGLGSTA